MEGSFPADMKRNEQMEISEKKHEKTKKHVATNFDFQGDKTPKSKDFNWNFNLKSAFETQVVLKLLPSTPTFF